MRSSYNTFNANQSLNSNWKAKKEREICPKDSKQIASETFTFCFQKTLLHIQQKTTSQGKSESQTKAH